MTTTYFFKQDPGEKVKVAPQAQLILAHIKKAGSKGITREDLCAKLDEDHAAGRLTTVQATTKLVGFYQTRLQDDELITFVKEKAEPKPKAEKAPAEKKTVASKKEKAGTAA